MNIKQILALFWLVSLTSCSVSWLHTPPKDFSNARVQNTEKNDTEKKASLHRNIQSNTQKSSVSKMDAMTRAS